MGRFTIGADRGPEDNFPALTRFQNLTLNLADNYARRATDVVLENDPFHIKVNFHLIKELNEQPDLFSEIDGEIELSHRLADLYFGKLGEVIGDQAKRRLTIPNRHEAGAAHRADHETHQGGRHGAGNPHDQSHGSHALVDWTITKYKNLECSCVLHDLQEVRNPKLRQVLQNLQLSWRLDSVGKGKVSLLVTGWSPFHGHGGRQGSEGWHADPDEATDAEDNHHGSIDQPPDNPGDLEDFHQGHTSKSVSLSLGGKIVFKGKKDAQYSFQLNRDLRSNATWIWATARIPISIRY